MDDSELKFEIDVSKIENKVIKGQRWIALNGNYTPEQLRNLADQIENEWNKINVDSK